MWLCLCTFCCLLLATNKNKYRELLSKMRCREIFQMQYQTNSCGQVTQSIPSSHALLCQAYHNKVVPRSYQLKKLCMHFRGSHACNKHFSHTPEKSGLGELDLILPPIGHVEELIISLQLQKEHFFSLYLVLTFLDSKQARGGDCNCVCTYRHTHKKMQTRHTDI